jgi:hypothetical protein
MTLEEFGDLQLEELKQREMASKERENDTVLRYLKSNFFDLNGTILVYPLNDTFI